MHPLRLMLVLVGTAIPGSAVAQDPFKPAVGDTLPATVFREVVPPARAGGQATLGARTFRLNRPGVGYTLIEFGSTVCRECVTSFPGVVERVQKLRSDVEFVWVAPARPATAWELLADYQPLPFAAYVDTSTNSRGWGTLAGISVVPMVVLADEAGTVMRRAVGEAEIFDLLSAVADHGAAAVAQGHAELLSTQRAEARAALAARCAALPADADPRQPVDTVPSVGILVPPLPVPRGTTGSYAVTIPIAADGRPVLSQVSFTPQLGSARYRDQVLRAIGRARFHPAKRDGCAVPGVYVWRMAFH